jgi:hypothetical protein
MSDELPAALLLFERDPPVKLGESVPRGTYGLVLRDQEGREHHFGSAVATTQYSTATGTLFLVFRYLVTYGPDGEREDRSPDLVLDELRQGFELVEPTAGPRLTALTVAGLSNLADTCNQVNGFVTEYEKTAAVRTFLALREANEPFPPAEVEVWAAEHGWSKKQAADLRELAERVIEGRRFRPAIRLDPGQGRRMIDYWRERSGDDSA